MNPSVAEQCALLSFKVRLGPTVIEFCFQFPQCHQEFVKLAVSKMFNLSQQLATCLNPVTLVLTPVVLLLLIIVFAVFL